MAAEIMTRDDEVIARYARRGAEPAGRAVASARASAREVHHPDAGNAAAGDSARMQWPEPMDAVAFHGLPGEIVRAIEPISEADPTALLVQVLVSFGALVGRTAHVRVEGDQHYANLFALLVEKRRRPAKEHPGGAYARSSRPSPTGRRSLPVCQAARG